MLYQLSYAREAGSVAISGLGLTNQDVRPANGTFRTRQLTVSVALAEAAT